jgi:hypothetical protein
VALADRLYTTQEAFLARVSSSSSQVRKRAQWEKSGERYLRSYPTMPRGSLITVDPAIRRMSAELIEQAFPAIAAAFNRHLVPVAERAFGEWPVLTGLSKSLLSLDFVYDEDTTISGTIRCTAPYTFFIYKGKAARDLVFTPGERAADQMARELADNLS